MRRISYLDGLRGIACMQVVLYHYFYHLCLPHMPLNLFDNGAAAVCLFFIISGMVLTAAFEKAECSALVTVASRYIRLQLPSYISCVFSYGIILCLAALSSLNAEQALHISALQMFAARWPGLLPIQVLNFPLWTIGIECQGSVLILFLVWLRKMGKVYHIPIVITALSLLGINEFSLFIMGHIFAILLQNPRRLQGLWWLGVVAFLSGLVLCQLPQVMVIPGLFGSMCVPQFEVGAVMIMAGLILLPVLQTALQHKVPQYLGEISFSVYLLHWPIMMSLGKIIFYLLSPSGSIKAACMTYLAGLTVTLVLSHYFHQYIDIPIVNATRRLKKFQWSTSSPPLPTSTPRR